MKLKCTKVFANLLNKWREELRIESARLVTMSAEAYERNVDYNIFNAVDYGDTDYDEEGRMIAKAIRIDYPCEYYAMPRFLTTKELVTEWRRMKGQTMDDLKRIIKNMIEI